MNRLKELRRERRMQQEDIAKILNVTKTSISRYELGQRQLDPAMIDALCDLFGCTSDYFLGRSNFRELAVCNEDAQLLETYHALPLEIRRAVDGLMEPYRAAVQEKTGS